MKDLLHPSPYPRIFVPIVSSNLSLSLSLSLPQNTWFAPLIELASCSPARAAVIIALAVFSRGSGCGGRADFERDHDDN